MEIIFDDIRLEITVNCFDGGEVGTAKFNSTTGNFVSATPATGAEVDFDIEEAEAADLGDYDPVFQAKVNRFLNANFTAKEINDLSELVIDKYMSELLDY